MDLKRFSQYASYLWAIIINIIGFIAFNTGILLLWLEFIFEWYVMGAITAILYGMLLMHIAGSIIKDLEIENES